MAQANENDEEVLEQLVQAAETGDVAILRTLLTDHHDLALHGDYSFAAPVSRTLLHIACIARERECVVELLKAGADANAVDDGPRSGPGRSAAGCARPRPWPAPTGRSRCARAPG